ncbi:MAG: hypothetical protein HKN26_11525 [Acidimicrobiales bacterium]|nr:hypothetical protein [Acidimicrobiales bacterium]
MRKLRTSILFVLLLAGCGSGVDDAADPSDPAPSSAAEVPPGDATQADPTATEPTATDTAPNTTAPEPEAPPLIGFPNAGTITQHTPTTGNGLHPALAWDPIEGATEYAVVVFHANGEAWWSWYGPETEVVLGGVATNAPAGGPRAGDGVTWAVVGYDAQGTPLATSARRTVSS